MRWLILALLLTIFACHRKAIPTDSREPRVTADTMVSSADTSFLADTASDITLPQPPDTLLFFKRSGCFGKCPAYDLAIWTDGTAHYNGRAYTDLQGQWVSKLDSLDLQKVNKWIVTHYLDQLAPSYPTDPEEWIADLPSTTLIWKMKGKSGMIFHNHSAPQHYRNLEKRIDLWIEEQEWIKDPPSPEK